MIPGPLVSGSDLLQTVLPLGLTEKLSDLVFQDHFSKMTARSISCADAVRVPATAEID